MGTHAHYIACYIGWFNFLINHLELEHMLTRWLLQGWVIIQDRAPLVESARALTTRLKWDARVVEIESNSDERLLICQKPFFKRQPN